jgi:tryptophan synthase alpha chain
MSRIDQRFALLQQQGRKALIPFVTAGDPDLATTQSLMHGLVAAGADIIELGVPFSDPMADGPIIQRASERALANGVTLTSVLELVRQFRTTDQQTPVVLMGYANPVEAMGWTAFCRAARQSGVDGVLTVDYPPEESAEFAAECAAAGLDNIYLLAPTTPEARIAAITRLARGFVYYVSLKGVTGAATLDLGEVAARVAMIRSSAGLPVGVGFGIRDAETARQVAEVADAVVIGSRIVQEIEHSAPEAQLDNVRTFLAGVRAALDK